MIWRTVATVSQHKGAVMDIQGVLYNGLNHGVNVVKSVYGIMSDASVFRAS